jgi:hypothetical protein
MGWDLLKELNVQDNGIIKDKTFDKGQILRDRHNVKIINCTFKCDEEDEDLLHLDNCDGCVVLKCKFQGKHTAGLALLIDGVKSKNNKVVGCTFSDLTLSDEYKKKFKEKHGKAVNAEPIRLGGSPISGCWFGTTVNWCLFDKLNADVETVSIKSCGNVLENNKHNDCKSSITIRHGGCNTIRNNVFIGSGGIRVYGFKNEITGNYHKNNNNKNKPPLTIATGTWEDDPNFNNKGEPPVNNTGEHINEKGCKHHVYARAKFNTIADNMYDNCKVACVRWGTGHNTLKKDKGDFDKKVCKDNKTYGPLKEYLPPTNNVFINNKTSADDENKDSTFVKAQTDEDRADMTNPENNNKFQGNKLHNVTHGHLPEEPRDSDKPLTLTKPKAGPDEMPSDLEQTLLSS